MRRHVGGKVEFVAIHAVEQFLDDPPRHLARAFDRRGAEERREQPPLPAMLFTLQRRCVACEKMIGRPSGASPPMMSNSSKPTGNRSSRNSSHDSS